MKRKFESISDIEEPPLDDRERKRLYDDIKKVCKMPIVELGLLDSVRTRLEKLKPDVRKKIVSFTHKDTHPLFLACWYENMEIVKYLTTYCNADVNKEGKVSSNYLPLLQDINTPSVIRRGDNTVSPLWIAAVHRKNLPMVKFLISHGANVNAILGTKLTVFQELCLSPGDITEMFTYLLENGADIHKHFYYYPAETCLMKCLERTNELLLLLKHGADINAVDILDNTALQKAVKKDKIDTVKLLLSHNANPNVRNYPNTDVLLTACICGSIQSFEYLVKNVHYSTEKLADAYELMGYFLSIGTDENDKKKGFEFLKKSLDMRRNMELNGRLLPNNCCKIIKMIFPNAKEFITREDLNRIMTNWYERRMQWATSLERIFGINNDFLVSVINEQTILYSLPDRIDLWRQLMEILVEQDSIMLHECYSLWRHIKGLIDDIHQSFHEYDSVKFSNITVLLEPLFMLFSKFKLVLKMDSRRELYIHYDVMWLGKIILLMCQSIILLLEIAETDKDHTEIRNIVWKFMHGSDTDQDYYTMKRLILNFSIDYMGILVPSRGSIFLKMIKLFLDLGADINTRNIFNRNRTPLLSALLTISENYNKYQFLAEPLVQLLLDYGSHIDSPDIYGNTSFKVLVKISLINVNFMKYMNLKCFAAQAIGRHRIQFNTKLIPAHLYHFFKCHK